MRIILRNLQSVWKYLPMLESLAYQRRQQKLRIEAGPEILHALEDPNTVEIMLNSDGRLWVERCGQEMTEVGRISPLNAEALIGTVADSLGIVATRETPIVEGEFALDGSRFEGLLPPIVNAPIFTIRKKPPTIFTLDDYVRQGIADQQQRERIESAISRHENILVVGGTGSGKTTLTNAIIDGIAAIHPDDRLVIIEDTAEIRCRSENAVILRSTVDVSMERLLRATMRLRPDRIVVGEVRGMEALSLLKAWNTGHPGGVATVHANSAQAGLIRLEQLIAESGSQKDMRPLIAEAVNVVLFIARDNSGRKISEMIEVEDFVNDTFQIVEYK